MRRSYFDGFAAKRITFSKIAMAFSLFRRVTNACRRRHSLKQRQTGGRSLLTRRGPGHKQRVCCKGDHRQQQHRQTRNCLVYSEGFTWRVSQVARWGLSWSRLLLYEKVFPTHPSRPRRKIRRRTGLPLCRWQQSVRKRVTFW